jgi:hypothetical protein
MQKVITSWILVLKATMSLVQRVAMCPILVQKVTMNWILVQKVIMSWILLQTEAMFQIQVQKVTRILGLTGAMFRILDQKVLMSMESVSWWGVPSQ